MKLSMVHFLYFFLNPYNNLTPYNKFSRNICILKKLNSTNENAKNYHPQKSIMTINIPTMTSYITYSSNTKSFHNGKTIISKPNLLLIFNKKIKSSALQKQQHKQQKIK